MTAYKIDIGCGAFKKDGFIGVDFVPSPGVDHVVNLETESLPFPDRSCDFIYSSHCLEHISNPNHLFSEIGRVSSNGAKIEFWVPYAHHNDALLLGHHQYYTEEFWNHVCVQHADFWHSSFGGYWLWKTICYVIPERIKEELDRLNIDLNFAIRHLNNVVKEISFEFEFSIAEPTARVLPDRKYALSRNDERYSLPNVDDATTGAIKDPDCRDFTSLTLGLLKPLDAVKQLDRCGHQRRLFSDYLPLVWLKKLPSLADHFGLLTRERCRVSNANKDSSVDLYERRWLKARDHIHGRGIEIGAGTSPQKLPQRCEAVFFDKRTRAELSEHHGTAIPYEVRPIDDVPKVFPDGADFLVAHHVLEHAPDPIGTLRSWHRLVRPTGTIVISVPYFALCPDRDRLLPDFDHLLLDHLFNRDGDSFESREHVLSFLCSWVDDSPGLNNLSKSDCCRRIVAESKRGNHDFHWHAFDHDTLSHTIFAAALLDNSVPEILETTSDDENVLDILCVYRLTEFSRGKDEPRVDDVIDKIRAVVGKLNNAAGQITSLPWYG